MMLIAVLLVATERIVDKKEASVKDTKAEIAKLKSTTRQLKRDLKTKSEKLFAAKAELEYHRMNAETGGHEGNSIENNGKGGENVVASKRVFMTPYQDYEREIAQLKKQLANAKA
eukprot:6346801-Ditylum_brightwellii.AAC.2